MIHINSYVKEHPIGFLIEPTMPEEYNALTIEDFVNSKDMLIPTEKILPMAAFAYGKSIINFPELQFINISRYHAVVSDYSGEIIINYFNKFAQEAHNVKPCYEEITLFNPKLAYEIENKSIYIISCHLNKPQPKIKEEKDFAFDDFGMFPNF